MDDLYYQKYLKYKNKYLSLKQDLEEQDGGAKMKTVFTVTAKVNGIEKEIEFGTITDQRSHIKSKEPGRAARFEKVGHPIPYIKMDKKEHQIINAFGESGDKVIVKIIESKDISKLNEIKVYDKPCLTAGSFVDRSFFGGHSTCQKDKDRGTLELNLTDVAIKN